VTEAEARSVAAWLHDPHGWAATRQQRGEIA
jgi:hypothetical protein